MAREMNSGERALRLRNSMKARFTRFVKPFSPRKASRISTSMSSFSSSSRRIYCRWSAWFSGACSPAAAAAVAVPHARGERARG
jgi:hypothetical protein